MNQSDWSSEELAKLQHYLYESQAARNKSNQELAQWLIENIWAKLPASSPLCAMINEIINRLDPTLIKEE